MAVLSSLIAGGRRMSQDDVREVPLRFGPIDAGATIGHVHLKVADLERALDFYCGILGFELVQRYGTSAAFISAGGYHHHIGLNTWESLRRRTRRASTTSPSSIRSGPRWRTRCAA
jgi:catechol-2,3-dioxygenase